MGSLKKIADRIKTIKSTRQVTASMKVVAISRLRKLHETFLRTAAYTEEMNRMIRRLIRSASARQEALLWQGSDETIALPHLLTGNGREDRYLIAAITSDDGLSGSSNVQVIQKTGEVVSYLKKKNKEITVLCFGSRGGELFKRFYPNVRALVMRRKMLKGEVPYLDAERLALDLVALFNQDKFDVAICVYNKFKSIVSQRPTIEQLIPNKLFSPENPWQFLIDTNDLDYIGRDALGQKKIALHQTAFLKAIGLDMFSPMGALDADLLTKATRLPESYDYEPSDLGILNKILPQYIVSYINRVLLETEVGDNAARMMAMDNATRNAGDMLQQMQKQYRRTRQGKITTDIAEVTSGAMFNEQA